MAIIKELPYIYLIINQIFTTEYDNMAILFQKTFSCEAKITEDLTILITIQLATQPKVESIVWDKRASNCSIIENIPPKGVSFSDFICIFGHVIHRILLFIFFATLR